MEAAAAAGEREEMWGEEEGAWEGGARGVEREGAVEGRGGVRRGCVWREEDAMGGLAEESENWREESEHFSAESEHSSGGEPGNGGGDGHASPWPDILTNPLSLGAHPAPHVCGGGGSCAGGGVPLGASPCCPDVGRCVSGVNIIIIERLSTPVTV